MDSITHSVIGACLGDAMLGKKIGKKAMLWGALAANLPDIDVLYSSWQPVPDNLLAHRGFTHSILFCTLIIPVLAWLFQKFYQQHKISFKTWLLFFIPMIYSHIAIDSLTNYGTGLLLPFSNYRTAVNTIFVADPFFTIPMLLATIALLVLKNHSRFRNMVTMAACTLSSAYLIFTFVNKYHINEIFESSLQHHNLSYTSYFTQPTPLNNFLWYDVAKTDSGYFIGYRSLFDRSPAMELFYLARNDLLIQDFRHDKAVNDLIRFSQDYYVITSSDSGKIVFHDIRFGQLGFNAAAPFVFKFYITQASNSKALINEGRWEASTKDAFSQLMERIKGH